MWSVVQPILKCLSNNFIQVSSYLSLLTQKGNNRVFATKCFHIMRRWRHGRATSWWNLIQIRFRVSHPHTPPQMSRNAIEILNASQNHPHSRITCQRYRVLKAHRLFGPGTACYPTLARGSMPLDGSFCSEMFVQDVVKKTIWIGFGDFYIMLW